MVYCVIVFIHMGPAIAEWIVNEQCLHNLKIYD